MNYYRRYSGDYLRDTARLTLTEHGAYTLLLDYYYSDEKPMPLDHDELYLLVRAMKKEDQKAVDKVISIYFTAQADGYHQKRVDAEIETSQQARSNGKNGGRPTRQKTGSETGSETGPATKPKTGSETARVTDNDETGYENVRDLETGLGHPPATSHQPGKRFNQGGAGTGDVAALPRAHAHTREGDGTHG